MVTRFVWILFVDKGNVPNTNTFSVTVVQSTNELYIIFIQQRLSGSWIRMAPHAKEPKKTGARTHTSLLASELPVARELPVAGETRAFIMVSLPLTHAASRLI